MALISTTLLCLAASVSDGPAGTFCKIETQPIVRCPAMATYSDAESVAVGRALAALRARDPGNPLLRVVEDAFALRHACRAMPGGLPMTGR